MVTTEAKTRVAVTAVGLDPISYGTLTHFMTGFPGAVMNGNLDCFTGVEREVGRGLETAHTPICFIDYDQNFEQAVRITERLHSDYPDVYIFATSTYVEPERIISAMRAGCMEYLLKPIQNDRLQDGLARMEARQKEKARSRVRGKVITLLGAKGGTGVTSIALHLALQLADGGNQKCLLIDQHTALGDVSLYLGTGRHQYSFYELASNMDRLDEELLQGFLLQHPSGLHILDSPEAVEASQNAPASAVEQTLAFLADTYKFVLIDSPPGLSDMTLACIAQSDQVAIVLTAELASVRNAVRYMEYLGKTGYSSSKINVILNRHSKRGPLTDDRIEQALGRKISLRVPNSYQEVVRAINSGEPISSEKSDFAAAMHKWAHDLSSGNGNGNAEGESRETAAARRTGLLALFAK
jgi:pilus assembly protein CpaE